MTDAKKMRHLLSLDQGRDESTVGNAVLIGGTIKTDK
jgi:hypothetical protein